jgi:carboxyl-terminal processing protease
LIRGIQVMAKRLSPPACRVACVLFLAVLLTPAAFAQQAQQGQQGQGPQGAEQQKTIPVREALADFDAVWQLVNEGYVDAGFGGVDWAALKEQYRPKVEAAADGEAAYKLIVEMVGQLKNPNTAVVPPWAQPSEESSDAEVALEYSGVGILLSQLEAGEIVVLTVFKKSPAEAAGVLVGDVIVGVNDWRVGGENPMQAVVDRVRGPVGTPVTLVLKDPEGQERSLEIKRAQIDLRPSVEYRFVEGTIGYLRIPVLSSDLVEEASKALPRLLSASGLILDLRSVSAGSLEGLVRVAQWFLGAAHMGGFASREGAQAIPYREDAMATFRRPLVVLTNPATYGVGEILAQLLREYKRAQLAGNPTQGHFELVRSSKLPSGGELYLSIGRYLSPQGTPLPQEGLKPDVVLELPDLATLRKGRDVYIEKAIEVLRGTRG